MPSTRRLSLRRPARSRALTVVLAVALLAVSTGSQADPDDLPFGSALVSSPFDPSSVRAPDGLVVTSDEDVYGDWTLVRAAGGPIPLGTDPHLQLASGGPDDDGPSVAFWTDGTNSVSAEWHVGPRGHYRRGSIMSTAVSCPPDACVIAGYGVSLASELWITAAGELLYVDATGHELAAYVRDTSPSD